MEVAKKSSWSHGIHPPVKIDRWSSADFSITGIAKDKLFQVAAIRWEVGPFPGLYTMNTDNFSPIRHVELGR